MSLSKMRSVPEACCRWRQVTAGSGYFYEPTIVTEISDGTRLVDGGTVRSCAAPSCHSATRPMRSNGRTPTHFGLGGSIWTNDVAHGMELATNLECDAREGRQRASRRRLTCSCLSAARNGPAGRSRDGCSWTGRLCTGTSHSCCKGVKLVAVSLHGKDVPDMISTPERSEAAPYFFTYIDRVPINDVVGLHAAQVDPIPDNSERHIGKGFSVSICAEQVVHAPSLESCYGYRAHFRASGRFWFARGLDSPLPSCSPRVAGQRHPFWWRMRRPYSESQLKSACSSAEEYRCSQRGPPRRQYAGAEEHSRADSAFDH